MSLQEFLSDAKNILLGKADEESQVDLKDEINRALKNNEITKEMAVEMLEAIKNVKTEAKALEKKQLSTISLEDGTVVSEDEAKKKKEELERKRKEKEAKMRMTSEQARQVAEKTNENRKPTINSKKSTQSGKLTIDRNKLQKAIEKEEREDKSRMPEERDGKN